MSARAAPSAHPVRCVEVIRSGSPAPTSDQVAVEAPLEVRLNGEPFAVIMRTPGRDADLALGFLVSEGLVQRRGDVQRIDVDELLDRVNVVFARGRADAVAAAFATRRQVTMSSSCGLCGRRSHDSLAVHAPRVTAEWTVDSRLIDGLPSRLIGEQSAFAQTGGLHAAGIFEHDGRLAASAEDVGRHNAVDKLLGRMFDGTGFPLSNAILLVSGRASFEIVQKAWIAGVPLVAAVSAPSSLAVDLARDAGITLLGFVREGRFNVYTHAQRIDRV